MEDSLNTLLDLKVENHRLQRKIMEYKSRVAPGSSTSTQLPSSQATPIYATSSLHPASRVLSTTGITCQELSDPSNSFDQAVLVASGSNYSLDFSETLYDSNSSNLDEANEGSKKKKVSI